MKRFIHLSSLFIGQILGQLMAVIGLKVLAFILLEIFLLFVIHGKTDYLTMIFIIQFPATLFVITRSK